MSNSGRSKWKFTEQTVIWVRIKLEQHTQSNYMTSMTQRQDTLIRTKPGHWIHQALEKLNVAFSSWPPHRTTILKFWESKCIISNEATPRCPRTHALHQPKNITGLCAVGIKNNYVNIVTIAFKFPYFGLIVISNLRLKCIEQANTTIDLRIVFLFKLYKSCITTCGNKLLNL